MWTVQTREDTQFQALCSSRDASRRPSLTLEQSTTSRFHDPFTTAPELIHLKHESLEAYETHTYKHAHTPPFARDSFAERL